MKIITYILIAFFCINLSSQIKGGHATYKIKFETSHLISNSEIVNNGLKIFKSFNEPTKNMEFDLFFNKKESIFNIKNKLNVSHNAPAYNFAVIMSRGKGKFYCSTKERLRQKEGFGDIFIIKYDYIKKSDWILKNETKIIKDYLCYKAIINNEEFNNLVAWYCPKLPFNFGPIGIGNLPGLILELTTNTNNNVKAKIVYSISDLILSSKKNNYKIERFKKGKKITKSEFDKLGRELIIKMRGY